MIILLHTSKTMRPPALDAGSHPKPELLDVTIDLSDYLKTLNDSQLAKSMHVSSKLAQKTHDLIAQWSDAQKHQRPAIDSFLGDIYSGLQTHTWTDGDREYAQNTLRILSGLYGILKPLDGIYPYRLEMGYKLPHKKYANLYRFWGNRIAKTLPQTGPIVNLTAVEYSKVINPYIDIERMITPRFLTVKNGEPIFVVVHAKIARGAFARWLIVNRISDIQQITNFNDIGYTYNAPLSTHESPVFVCQEFGGIGLSVRLT